MMSFTLYIYSKCSTCQKALRFLEQRQISFKRKEITETPPSPQELRKMLEFLGGNIKSLFNTSGLLYRELQLSEKLTDMSSEQALNLLAQNGMLVKRPFLIGDTTGIVGFRESQWLTASLFTTKMDEMDK